jgi:hypothetical protein
MKKIFRATMCGVLALLPIPACTEVGPPSGDTVAPQVIEFTPQGEDVPRDATITVRFSESMSEALVHDHVVVVPSEQVDADFLKDLDSPPLSVSRQAAVVDCESSFDQDHVLLSLNPSALLAPGSTYQVVVSAAATDAAGNPLVNSLSRDNHGMLIGQNAHAQHTFTTHLDVQPPNVSGDAVVISEVQANPLGEDSQGEYIELICLGAAPCDLSGYRISDQSGDASGQSIVGCSTDGSLILQPQHVALLVSRSFVPPSDLTSETTALCIDSTTLTPYGLKNSAGEVLTILNPLGQEVTRYGGSIDFSIHENCSAIRIDLQAADSQENWEVRTGETCRSPGWVD